MHMHYSACYMSTGGMCQHVVIVDRNNSHLSTIQIGGVGGKLDRGKGEETHLPKISIVFLVKGGMK